MATRPIPAPHHDLIAAGAPDSKHALRLAAHLWRHPRAGFLRLAGGPTRDVLLIRSYGCGSALARLQSDPLAAGLAAHGRDVAKIVYHPAEALTLPPARTLIISYDDDASIIRARAYRRETGARVICLTADLYSFARHRFLDPLVDVFVAPTALHRQVLQSAVRAPVIAVPEGVDPIALAAPPSLTADNEAMCWFGYPASFAKSMRYLIAEAERRGVLAPPDLTCITRKGTTLRPGYRHVAFDGARFHADTAGFGFAVLSHFAYDGHLNTLIKSPNKLVTALARGLIPLVSDTPAYRAIIDRYGLGDLVFTGPRSFADLIANRDAAAIRRRHDFAAIARDLCAELSPAAIAQTFLAGLATCNTAPDATPAPTPAREPIHA